MVILVLMHPLSNMKSNLIKTNDITAVSDKYYKKQVHDKFLAVAVLFHANKCIFGHILTELCNQYQLGTDTYLHNIPTALDLLQTTMLPALVLLLNSCLLQLYTLLTSCQLRRIHWFLLTPELLLPAPKLVCSLVSAAQAATTLGTISTNTPFQPLCLLLKRNNM